jgi:hypothetical protein
MALVPCAGRKGIDAEFALLDRALDRDPVSHRWHPL